MGDGEDSRGFVKPPTVGDVVIAVIGLSGTRTGSESVGVIFSDSLEELGTGSGTAFLKSGNFFVDADALGVAVVKALWISFCLVDKKLPSLRFSGSKILTRGSDFFFFIRPPAPDVTSGFEGMPATEVELVA